MFIDTISRTFLQICFILNFSYLDPVEIFEEGQYNLNNLKEITVTDSFMGLDRETRNCQDVEAYDDCKTKSYVENFALRLSEKVKFKFNE